MREVIKTLGIYVKSNQEDEPLKDVSSAISSIRKKTRYKDKNVVQ